MSSNWPLRKLSDLTKSLNAKRVPVSSLERQKRQGPYRYYGASGVVDYVDDFIFDGTYLLVSEDGENLRTRNTPIAFKASGKYWVNNHAHILDETEPGVLDFLEHAFRLLDISPYITGAVQPKLNKRSLEQIELPVPDVDERLRVNNLLCSFDDKIELNRRMNETLEEMARALFRDWFVDFGPTRRQMDGATDPAAIMGHAFPPEKAVTLAPLFPDNLSDNGLPQGWEKRVLHDLTDWVNGAAYKNMHFSTEPDALPVIKIAELKAGVTKTTKHTNTALGDKYRIKNGEVLFSWSGNPDTSIDTFIWSGGDAWLNQHIFAVRPNGEVHQAVLYFLLKYLRPQFAEIARDKQTTGLGHVTKQDLKGMRICLGSDDVESVATEVFSPLFAKLYANQQENQTLAEMRDLLLPKLMSGEIRLKDAEVTE